MAALHPATVVLHRVAKVVRQATAALRQAMAKAARLDMADLLVVRTGGRAAAWEKAVLATWGKAVLVTWGKAAKKVKAARRCTKTALHPVAALICHLAGTRAERAGQAADQVAHRRFLSRGLAVQAGHLHGAGQAVLVKDRQAAGSWHYHRQTAGHQSSWDRVSWT